MTTYLGLIDRTAIVNCIGSHRNYSLDMIQEALEAADVPSKVVTGICPRISQNKWEIMFINAHSCEKFVTVVRHLTVNSAVGLVECPITSFFDNLKCLRVRGLGLTMPVELAYEALAPYGDIKLVTQEKKRGKNYDV